MHALTRKTGTHGARRGIVYVSEAQCASLREEIGSTEQEAARRAKITVPQLRDALRCVDWRGTGAIPLATVQAVIERLKSAPGYTIEEAAEIIGKDAGRVEERIGDGTERPLRTKHDHRRPLYLSEPMIRRLREAVVATRLLTTTQAGRLRLGEAALEVGVTAATIVKRVECHELERVAATNGGAMLATPSAPAPALTGKALDFAARRRRNGCKPKPHADRGGTPMLPPADHRSRAPFNNQNIGATGCLGTNDRPGKIWPGTECPVPV